MFALKMVNKQYLTEYKKFEYLLRERKILIDVRSNKFAAQLQASFESANYFNFLLEFYPGGELFFHLTRQKQFTEGIARFYFVEALICLEELHASGILYRDLKVCFPIANHASARKCAARHSGALETRGLRALQVLVQGEGSHLLLLRLARVYRP